MADRNVKLLLSIVSSWDGKGAKQAEADTTKLGTSTLKLGTIAAGVGLAAGQALVQFGLDSVQTFGTFQSGMQEVFTLLPNISDQAMGAMTGDVQDFAREFGRLPEEVVPALYQALSAGVPQGNVFEFLETAQAAALGGVTTLETAVDGLSSVTNAYGADVISVGQASDIMFQTVRLGKTDFEQLSGSLFNVIPTAASLGVTFQDVAANMAAMTAQGTPTSVATTQLRQLMVEASKSGTQLDQTLRDLHGKGFADLIADGMTTAQIMESLRGSMPEQEFRDLFGSVEASNAALSITSDTAESVIDSFGGLADVTGATAGAMETMVGTYDQLLARAEASEAVLKAQAGEALSPLARKWQELRLSVTDYLADDLALRNQLTASSAQLEQYKGSGEGLRFTLQALGEGTVLWRDTMVDAEVLARRTQIAVDLLEGGFEGNTRELKAAVLAQESAILRTQEMEAHYGDLVEETTAVTEETEKLTEAQSGHDDVLRRVNRTLYEQVGFVGEDTRALEDMAYAMGELPGHEEALARAIEEANAQAQAQEEQAQRNAEAYEFLGGRIDSVRGPIGDLIAAQEDLASSSGEAAEEAQGRIVAANEAIGASYRQLSLDILSSKLAEAYGEDALGAQLAAIQQQEAFGLISAAQAEALADTAIKSDRVREVTSNMFDEFLEDGELTTAESEAVANAISLIEAGAMSSDEALRILAENGVSTFGDLEETSVGAADGVGALGVGFGEAVGPANALVDAAGNITGALERIPEDVTVQFVSDTSQWNPPTPSGGGSVNNNDGTPFADGGRVTGGVPGRDSVPSLLMPDEIVIPVSHTRNMADIVRFASRFVPMGGMARFAEGGMVGERPLAGLGGGNGLPSLSITVINEGVRDEDVGNETTRGVMEAARRLGMYP